MKSFKAIAAFAAFAAAVAASAAADQPMSEGEIRKVDPAAKKITIKHGELKNLDMPAMTMVFQVKDPAMLDKVKTGDKVKFRADKVNGAFMVVEIETIK
jgi:Cu(I)/Ag(I) efflux system protein CusF